MQMARPSSRRDPGLRQEGLKSNDARFWIPPGASRDRVGMTELTPSPRGVAGISAALFCNESDSLFERQSCYASDSRNTYRL